jgi:hypothetical protein
MYVLIKRHPPSSYSRNNILDLARNETKCCLTVVRKWLRKHKNIGKKRIYLRQMRQQPVGLPPHTILTLDVDLWSHANQYSVPFKLMGTPSIDLHSIQYMEGKAQQEGGKIQSRRDNSG